MTTAAGMGDFLSTFSFGGSKAGLRFKYFMGIVG